MNRVETSEFESVVATADVPDSNGNIFSAELLRKMADGERLFWDDGAQSLVYKGAVTIEYEPGAPAILRSP